MTHGFHLFDCSHGSHCFFHRFHGSHRSKILPLYFAKSFLYNNCFFLSDWAVHAKSACFSHFKAPFKSVDESPTASENSNEFFVGRHLIDVCRSRPNHHKQCTRPQPSSRCVLFSNLSTLLSGKPTCGRNVYSFPQKLARFPKLGVLVAFV